MNSSSFNYLSKLLNQRIFQNFQITFIKNILDIYSLICALSLYFTNNHPDCMMNHVMRYRHVYIMYRMLHLAHYTLDMCSSCCA